MYPEPDEQSREEFFAAKLFVSQDIRGSDTEYSELHNIYQINILANGVRCEDDDILHCFRFYDDEHDLNFRGRMHIIIIELAKAERLAIEKSASQMSAAESWAVFFRFHTDREKRGLVNEILKIREDIAMAGETALAFSKEENEYFYNMSKLKYELDMQSRNARMKRELREAREKALAEGHAEGRSEGFEEGRTEGLAEGRAEAERENRLEKLNSARKMKEAGLSADQIKMFTGLSEEETEKL